VASEVRGDVGTSTVVASSSVRGPVAWDRHRTQFILSHARATTSSSPLY